VCVCVLCVNQIRTVPLGLDNIVLPSEATRRKTLEAASEMSHAGGDSAKPKWKTGELEFEALMRRLENAVSWTLLNDMFFLSVRDCPILVVLDKSNLWSSRGDWPYCYHWPSWHGFHWVRVIKQLPGIVVSWNLLIFCYVMLLHLLFFKHICIVWTLLYTCDYHVELKPLTCLLT